MADIVKYYINNQEYNPPKDWQDTTLELSFQDDTQKQQVSFSDVTFVRENSTLIQDFISQYGVFVAIPFKKTVNSSVVFDGFISTSNDLRVSPMETSLKIIEKDSIDWINEIADSFSFEVLAKIKGIITVADYKIIPYVIEKPTDWASIAIMQLTVFSIINEINSVINQVLALSVESSNPFEATAVIRLALYFVYITILLATLIKLLSDILRYLIQEVKYHAGMTIRKHFEKACQYLNLNFSSSISELEWLILPEKYQLPSDGNGLFGNFTNSPSAGFDGYYRGTFGDFIREMKTIFKANISLIDGTLYFEKKNFSFGTPVFQLPNLDFRDEQISYNSFELNSNYVLSFQTDISDNHTILEYFGTSIQVVTENANLPNGWQTTLKGLNEIQIPYALGKRKTELSTVEKIANVFYQSIGGILNGLVTVANAVISGINQIIRAINRIVRILGTIGINLNFQFQTIRPLQTTGFGNTIKNRIGMLKLENDYFQTRKLLRLDGLKLNTFQPTAKYIWDNFHKEAVSFVGANPNQYKIYPSKKIRFKESDYLNVKNSKFVKTFDNKTAEVINLSWNDWEQTAEIEFKIREVYDTNLIENEIEPK